MKKSAKCFIIASIATAVVAVATIPSVFSILNLNNSSNPIIVDSQVNNNSTNNKYAFYLPTAVPGKELGYNSIDEALNEILSNKGSNVSNRTWVGDFDNAINAFTNEVIDFKDLRQYDNQRIGYAYKTANNTYVNNPSDAVRSYLTQTSRRYLDLNGVLWPTYAQAKEENDKYATNETMPVAFYKIKDVANNNKEIKINPLSKEDINFFKKRAIANLSFPTSGFSIDKIINTEFGTIGYTKVVSTGDEKAKVDAVFEILNLLAEYQQKLSYNISATLSDSGVVTVENRWVINKGENSYDCYEGGGKSKWENAKTPRPGTSDYKQANVVFKIEKVDKDGNKTYVNSIDFNGLSANETKRKLDVLVTPNTFKSSVSVSPVYYDYAIEPALKDDYWIDIWKREAPSYVPRYEYTGNYVYTNWRPISNSTRQITPYIVKSYGRQYLTDTVHWRSKHGDNYYNLFTNGQLVPKKDAEGNPVLGADGEPVMEHQPDYNIICDDKLLRGNDYWAYQAFVMNKPSNVWSSGNFRVNPIYFNVSVTADRYELDKEKNSFIERLTNIILKTLVYQNENILNSVDSNETFNQIKYQVQNIATRFFNVFADAIGQQYFTYNPTGLASEDPAMNFGDLRSNYFNLSKTTTLERKTAITDQQISSVKWIRSIYDSGIFLDLFDQTLNITEQLSSKYRSTGLIIHFNDVPVFMIEDASFLSTTIVDDSITKIVRLLQEWAASSRTFDPTKVLNISNHITFASDIQTFAMPEQSENITQVDRNYSNVYNPKLKRYLTSPIFTENELNAFQNLIIDFAADTELFRNDAGVDSAINLYNKNIAKITNKQNAQLYISEMKEEDIFDGEPLRLYKKRSYSDTINYLENPLPVYYGETRAKLGTFNPAVNERFVAVYKSQLDDIITKWEPEEVPIVIINGTEYKLALLANPNATQLTGDPDVLLRNAVRNLVSRMERDNNYLFYTEDDGSEKLIVNNVKSLYTYNLDIGILNNSIFNGKTTFSFLTREDALAYFRNQIEKNRIFK